MLMTSTPKSSPKALIIQGDNGADPEATKRSALKSYWCHMSGDLANWFSNAGGATVKLIRSSCICWQKQRRIQRMVQYNGTALQYRGKHKSPQCRHIDHRERTQKLVFGHIITGSRRVTSGCQPHIVGGAEHLLGCLLYLRSSRSSAHDWGRLQCQSNTAHARPGPTAALLQRPAL